ncbi:hypothetical protein HBI56_216300 [Parastagonospora nodorum]|uniref:Uncharacterized protein n=1 Tax=Phaeosphaeria nodorum (strain SN15 / ATCC MYA-4574 / FGSC 10173) TaxID=321614 RepID=A0A7U2I1D5_PHANO|nr:hypothetical protein HBH56_176160 [Parastagonospora nodorum]QRC96210.1 hypothetical protein JI435_300740 [Parastagonospora nodorum SN15]KAH3926394.1 hypothetical protein HBH54_167000 [Parastagonospora nodorum]KAH3939157.1 hypothetical protein HBH53_239920 [Parastagonospora nodorum]KAH3965660.1 hypothetical protein HBH52_203640 [Parastagonospora nodorum]
MMWRCESFLCCETQSHPTIVAQHYCVVNNSPNSFPSLRPVQRPKHLTLPPIMAAPSKASCRCTNTQLTSVLDNPNPQRLSTLSCHCRQAGLNRAVALLARTVCTWKSPTLLRHQ